MKILIPFLLFAGLLLFAQTKPDAPIAGSTVTWVGTDWMSVLQDADDKAITAERMANQWTIQMYQTRDVFNAAHKKATETCKGKLLRESGIWKCKEAASAPEGTTPAQ